jgi:ABC-type nitrate/sulfonate/bicarbonate transport system substrate-binding protein
MKALRAALVYVLLTLPAQSVHAADKVIAGSLGGQAPIWSIYVAVHKGFFKAEGLDLELNLAQSSAAVTQQATGGSLDVVLSAGITDPIRAIEKGANLALVRIIGNSAPYVLIGKPGLKSMADLKGKVISTGADNDIATAYLERMMEANGLKKGTYDILPAGVAAARFAALKAGVADAAIVLPPLNFVAEKAGFVTLGLAADYVKDLPFTGMAVNRRWAAANMAAARKVMAATDKSIAWFNDPAHRNEAVELLVKHGRAAKEDAERSYDYMHRIQFFEPTGKVSRQKLRNLVSMEQRAGTIAAGFSIERLAMPGLTELTD